MKQAVERGLAMVSLVGILPILVGKCLCIGYRLRLQGSHRERNASAVVFKPLSETRPP
jgi:hypothetical protein